MYMLYIYIYIYIYIYTTAGGAKRRGDSSRGRRAAGVSSHHSHFTPCSPTHTYASCSLTPSAVTEEAVGRTDSNTVSWTANAGRAARRRAAAASGPCCGSRGADESCRRPHVGGKLPQW